MYLNCNLEQRPTVKGTALVAACCTLFYTQHMEERCSFLTLIFCYCFLLFYLFVSCPQRFCVLLKPFTKKDVWAVKWLMQSWIWLIVMFDIGAKNGSQRCHFTVLPAVIPDDYRAAFGQQRSAEEIVCFFQRFWCNLLLIATLLFKCTFFFLLQSNTLKTVQWWGKCCTCFCGIIDPNTE